MVIIILSYFSFLILCSLSMTQLSCVSSIFLFYFLLKKLLIFILAIDTFTIIFFRFLVFLIPFRSLRFLFKLLKIIIFLFLCKILRLLCQQIARSSIRFFTLLILNCERMILQLIFILSVSRMAKSLLILILLLILDAILFLLSSLQYLLGWQSA